MRGVVVLAGMIWLAALRGDAAELAGYSTAPLLERPFVPYATVADRLARYTAWAEAKYPTLNPEVYGDARERGLTLVDAILKQCAIENRTEFNEFERGAMQSLFGWASKFGAYGADSVADHFAPANSSATGKGPVAPAPFQVAFEYPSLIVTADGAPWRLQFPFYFPINGFGTSAVEGGGTMNTVSLSTSFAAVKNGGGQATAAITFAHSADAKPENFETMWLRRNGMSGLHAADSPVPGARNFRIDELRLNLRCEITLLNDETGCYAILFMGRNGTYDVNRVSYLDFLRHVQGVKAFAKPE